MENIIENNRLIAEFMGGEVIEGRQGNVYWFKDGHHVYGHHKTLNVHAMMYHTSWDWLMPVVEKINQLCYEIHITYWKTEIFSEKYPDDEYFVNVSKTGKVKMFDLCYQTVIDFINYYNTTSGQAIDSTKNK